jgi:hypothetical protein
VKAELGRFPVENFINSQAILYLARLHTDNLNPLLKEAFELSKFLLSLLYLRKSSLFPGDAYNKSSELFRRGFYQ